MLLYARTNFNHDHPLSLTNTPFGLQWTVHGLGSARALQLVVAGLGAEVVATPRLQMAAMIVLATRTAYATRKPVAVRLIC